MALDDRLSSPAQSEHSLPSFLQLPIIRLLISGRASLSIFFLLTGFVNSLSFLKQVRASNQHAALPGLAKSSFRRIGRMILPAAAATSVSWVLCHLGAYRLAKRGEIAWFRDISPTPKSSLTAAIWDLLYNLWTTWAKSSNEYDKVQWNLFFLLKASLIVYTILLMTTFLTQRGRKACLIMYYIYGWMSNDGTYIQSQERLFTLTVRSSDCNERVCRDVHRRAILRSSRYKAYYGLSQPFQSPTDTGSCCWHDHSRISRKECRVVPVV